ncbi:hypothetical protein ACFY7H_18490 [Streptomyces sp. NPDC012794]|uniref:hypothetical protein n=1 Tax=Streptomyces sp. NPDC012794 TaxID=3364850 RepID=UPI0036C86DD2
MRTTMPAAAAALACAALLTVTGCVPGPGAANASPPSPAPDPLAGKDPAAVLRAAYEETGRTGSKNALVTRTAGDRRISAELTFEGDGGCWGKVTVTGAGSGSGSGSGEILMADGRLSFRGDAGFLRDQFRDGPVKSPDGDQGWIDVRPADPSVAHLVALCGAARPEEAFPGEPAGIRREQDTRQNGKPVAVFTSKAPDGTEITDHVLLDAAPYLVKHARGGPDSGSVEYTGVRPATAPSGAVSQAPPRLGPES